jgi:hypothetical protein
MHNRHTYAWVNVKGRREVQKTECFGNARLANQKKKISISLPVAIKVDCVKVTRKNAVV